MTPEQYDAYQEYRPERDDDTPQYPYQGFYDGDGSSRKRRKSGGHGGWWILVIVALVAACVIGFFSRYSMEIRQTSNGYTLSIQDGRDKTPESPVPDEGEKVLNQTGPTVQVPAAVVGSGTELTLTETPASPEMPGDAGLTLQQIYKKVIPSVVSITSTTYSGVASGTGIIMSSDGYIITNDHVIDGAVSIEILTSDDQIFSAGLVGSDQTSDLAVLKVDAKNLVAAEFGDSEQIEVGDSVVAIGDPLGRELRGTMTDGIISAINRDLRVNGRSMTLMQTNAALNNGNSGGPLINGFGQVIGINTMKMSSYYSGATVEGLGFAIPISTAKPIIDELIDQGHVSGRPAIGITGRVLPNAAQVYYRLPKGIYVDTVDENSDAYQQGISVGDIITAIEGEPVSTMDELNAVKNQFVAGDVVTLTIYHSGEWVDVDIVLMDAASME